MDMKSHFLGKTGIEVSEIALGTDYYGKTVPTEVAFSLLDLYVASGGTTIDTAHVYSDYLPGELHCSEKTIGKWFRSRKCRDKIIISTKGGFPELTDYSLSRVSYKEVKNDLEGSLECLGTEYIDIYWLHRDDEKIPAGELIEMLNEFKKSGFIRCFGASNFRAERIKEANAYAEAHGLEGFCASQIKWGLAITAKHASYDETLQEMNEQHRIFHEETKFPLFAYASQAKGFFSKLRRREDGVYEMPQGKCRDRYFCDENIEIYRRLEKKAFAEGKTVAELALRELLGAAFPVTCIVGCRNTEQLRQSLAAAE